MMSQYLSSLINVLFWFGDKIIIGRENLLAGMYFYEIINDDLGEIIGEGKFVVE